MPQTLGCIGGKPNHAHYFIGYLETDELLYLDPHVTQTYVDTTSSNDDTSYHCDRVNRMKFSGLDPSLALVRKQSIHHLIVLSLNRLLHAKLKLISMI